MQLVEVPQLQGGELSCFYSLGTEVVLRGEPDTPLPAQIAQIQHMLDMLDDEQAISSARLKLKLSELLMGAPPDSGASPAELYNEGMSQLLQLDSSAMCTGTCSQYDVVMDMLSAQIQTPSSLCSLPESRARETRRVFQNIALTGVRCGSRKARLLFPFVLQYLHGQQAQVHI
jgi:hypothetical protein